MNVESNLTETMQEKKKQILSEDHLICLLLLTNLDLTGKRKESRQRGTVERMMG